MTITDVEKPAAPPKRFHSMKIMDHTGHTTVTWDPDDAESVAAAKREWDRLKGQGYQAFDMTPIVENGVVVEEKRNIVREWSPALGRVLMIPQQRGG